MTDEIPRPPYQAQPPYQAPPPYATPDAGSSVSAYPQAFAPPASQARQGSGLALGSLITGIASLVMCGLGAVIGPVAVILGMVSRRRSRSDSRAVWGIVLGAVGTVLSIFAIVSAVITFSQQKDHEAKRAQAELAAAAERPSADAAPSELLLTEVGIAASGFDTAYAAYLDRHGVSTAFDGMYAGDVIDTPCFTMGGEAWWVTEGEPESCAPVSELWWEYKADATETEIKLFGSGGVGATIGFVPLTTEKVMTLYSSAELSAVANDVRDSMMPGFGCTDIVETPITLGGLPAVQFDCALDGYSSYRLDVVMLPQPRVLDDGTSLSGFIVESFNESEWIYSTEDVFARLDNTLVWK